MTFREKWIKDISGKWIQCEFKKHMRYHYFGKHSSFLRGYILQTPKGKDPIYSMIKESKDPLDLNFLSSFKRVTEIEILRKLEKIMTKALLKGNIPFFRELDDATPGED